MKRNVRAAAREMEQQHTHAKSDAYRAPIKPQFARQGERTLSRAGHTANLLETRMVRGRGSVGSYWFPVRDEHTQALPRLRSLDCERF